MVRAASPSAVLAIWERAYGYGPVRKGLALLSLAVPEETPARLAEFPIGARDRALLKLRATLFGDELHSVVPCPRCSGRVEIRFSVGDISLAPVEPSQSAILLEAEGRRWRLRQPCSADLVAVERLSANHSRRQALLQRCLAPIGELEQGSTVLPPDAELQTAIENLEEADPQANIQLAVDCPECGHNWSSRFDIVSFLWAEIDAWARRLLAEIHVLASAYGWSEGDILGISAWRRQIYLEMARR